MWHNSYPSLLGLDGEGEKIVAGYFARVQREQAAVGVHKSSPLDRDIGPTLWQLLDLSRLGPAVVLVVEVAVCQPKPAGLNLYWPIF